MSDSLIIETKGKDFELPTEGLHEAEISEVKDLGVIKTSWGDKQRILIRYTMYDQLDSKGEPVTAIETFNASLGQGSRLAERIETLTGRPPARRYDLKTLVGWNGKVVIQHNDSNGKTYANVSSVLRNKTKNVHGLEVTDADVRFPGD